MKTATWKGLMLGGLLLAGSLSALYAQNYSISWYKIAGGGGTSSNSQYTLSGTIGQHDAGGPMVGGPYSLTGGFWSLFAVQSPGAPLLRIFLTATNTAVVLWPSPSSGWNPQMNTNLVAAIWVTPPQTINDNGTTRFIIVSPPVGKEFFRLFHP